MHRNMYECETPKLAAHLAANTGSECADAGALCRPRANACACGCPCRSLGRPWEPIQCLPETGAAADGRCSPRKKDNLYPRWLAGEGPSDRLGHDWPQADAERRAEQRRMKKKRRKRKKRRSRCALTGRTRGGQCLR